MNACYAAIEYLYDYKSSEQNRADVMLALTLYETRKTNSTISAETASQTRVGGAKPKQIGKTMAIQSATEWQMPVYIFFVLRRMSSDAVMRPSRRTCM